MKRTRTVVAAVVLLLVVGAVVFVACRPAGTAAPAPTTGASATPTTSPGMTTEEFEAALFAGDVGTAEPVGTVEGELTDPPAQVPARVDVTQVLADEHSTLVRFTLATPDGSPADLGLPVFNQRYLLARDIRDVALVDPVAEQRYQPFIGVGVTDEENLLCACSTAPLTFSEGVPLTATFPPLDPSTETVTLEVPWLPALEDLPVTRP